MAREGHNGHNGHSQVHVTETPDVSHIKNVDVTHEASDVSVSALLKFVLALTVMTAFVAVLMWGLFNFFNAQEGKKEPAPGPMVMTSEERLPPEPRLQAAPGFGVKLADGTWVDLEKTEPEAEYRVLRQQWERQLKCDYEPAPPGCVPIDEAIRKLIEQGLPSRTAPAITEEPALPTAASSGRVSAKVVR